MIGTIDVMLNRYDRLFEAIPAERPPDYGWLFDVLSTESNTWVRHGRGVGVVHV